MKTLTALDLRKKLGSVLDGVVQEHEPVTITRANKPLVVIVSAEDYEEKVTQSGRAKKLTELSSRMDAWKRAHRKETARIDVAKAVREARQQR